MTRPIAPWVSVQIRRLRREALVWYQWSRLSDDADVKEICQTRTRELAEEARRWLQNLRALRLANQPDDLPYIRALRAIPAGPWRDA